MNKKTLISFALVFTILLSLLLASCSSKQNGSSFSPPSNGAGRNVTSDSSEITQSGEKLPPNGKTVIIDPGHGFRDPGAGAENYELGEGKMKDGSLLPCQNSSAKGSRISVIRLFSLIKMNLIRRSNSISPIIILTRTKG